MEIREDFLSILERTLDESIEEGLERMGWLLYYPDTDSADVMISAEDLRSLGIVLSSPDRSRVQDEILQAIKGFNNLSTRSKIIPYHTHPLPDHNIYPSTEDRAEIQRWNAPAVVVGSKKARDKYKLEPPFVVGYYPASEFNFLDKSIIGAAQHEGDLAVGEQHTQMAMKLLKVVPVPKLEAPAAL
tara:strand:- start:1270 stop:1827 length:558 start_codon:yes stop_codon:yes gene_type:complete